MNKYKQIHIQNFSSASVKERFLLVYNGRHYEAGAPVVDLIRCLQQENTQEEAVVAFVEKKKGMFSYAQVEDVITRLIQPMFADDAKPRKRTFLYERELFSASVIDRFSDACSFLFRKTVMFPLMIAVLAADICFFCITDNLLTFNGSANAYMVIGMLIFMVASSLFHELGHASACKHFGIRHGGIGFGLYLNFPVLYTDVTEVWRLRRTDRCIVNLAGVYFQMYILLAVLALFYATGSDTLRYMILTLNLGFIMTLNPFFKFDGYWIASDVLGIPNLRNRSKELLNYLYSRIRGRAESERPYLLQTNRLGRYGLLVYTVVVNLFMGYYFFYILPKFMVNFVASFPDEIHQLVLYLSNGMAPSFALLRNIFMQLVLLGLVGFMLYNVIRKLKVNVGRR
ncbi:hypothetical protein BACCOP_00693 [Phocaeicola coprocola DSM 17136]|uniref:Peptidase, M50 family n=2 Tax=Phocaeicola coprocola TaxID=310298 RepID=B3JFP2_9BACT|nr:hypothetical protein [Phocaeicola coprocola]EDV02203.1 hypothetical protein BACCOP_00693 [Phocaeicola coprocola DSM 17136]